MNRMRKYLFSSGIIVAVWITLVVSPARAQNYLINDRPLNLFGYITQGAAVSLHGDKPDTEEGLQSLLFNLFLEADYGLAKDLKIYGAGMLTTDFIYQVKHDDDSWNAKLFDQSKAELNVDDNYWQLLKETHLTWTPGNFLFRMGKQIVAWGEMNGFRLMDQINPLDQRRGFADVEFENSIIPIWLLRSEYFKKLDRGWIQDLGLEFIFNPNADFIANQLILPGNDTSGIWAPRIFGPDLVDLSFFGIPGLSLFPTSGIPALPSELQGIAAEQPITKSRLGSANLDLEELDNWEDGHEFGARLKGIIWDTFFTLNFFSGYENDPVVRVNAANPYTITTAFDGTPLLHLNYEGTYHRFKFTGVTLSRDITPLRMSMLGGVAPVLFLEAFYGFDTTFVNSSNALEKNDELRWAMSADWKIKLSLLNPRAYFTIMPQFYHRKILDFPADGVLTGSGATPLEDDNYITTLLVSTTYFHNKLVPSFFWMRDITNKAYLLRLQFVYDHSNFWHYTLGGLWAGGEKTGAGLELFENKDHLFFKISYRWG